MRRRASATALAVIAGVLVLPGFGGTSWAAAPPGDARLERQLQRDTGGVARLARPRGTSRSHLIGTTPAHPVPRPRGLAAGASPEAAARAHLRTYGELLGVSDEARDLRVERSERTT